MSLWKFKLDAMANKEQLEIFETVSVKVWNKWREENSNVDIDLNAAFLSTNVNCRGINLSQANLMNTSFRGVDLTGANLMGANLMGADFT